MSDLAEELKFAITLSGTYWGDRNPEFDIVLDDQILLSDRITRLPSTKGLPNPVARPAEINELTLQRFEVTATVEPGDHVLGVVFKNKQADDTCGFQEDGTWMWDKMLHIEAVEMDDIDIETLVYSEGTYTYTDSTGTEQTVAGSTSMSWNGTWSLKFSTPLYIWMLERL
jgi:hypothetical protein